MRWLYGDKTVSIHFDTLDNYDPALKLRKDEDWEL